MAVGVVVAYRGRHDHVRAPGLARVVEGALEELKKASGKVYKSTGAILLESNKDSLAKELAEKKETMLVRSQVLGKQEEKLRSKLMELKGKIEAATKGMKGAG